MVNFYVTNQYINLDKKLVLAGETIVISEETANKLQSKNYGYITGKAIIKNVENKKNSKKY